MRRCPDTWNKHLHGRCAPACFPLKCTGVTRAASRCKLREGRRPPPGGALHVWWRRRHASNQVLLPWYLLVSGPLGRCKLLVCMLSLAFQPTWTHRFGCRSSWPSDMHRHRRAGGLEKSWGYHSELRIRSYRCGFSCLARCRKRLRSEQTNGTCTGDLGPKTAGGCGGVHCLWAAGAQESGMPAGKNATTCAN